MKILNQASNNKQNIEIAIIMLTKVEFIADNVKKIKEQHKIYELIYRGRFGIPTRLSFPLKK